MLRFPMLSYSPQYSLLAPQMNKKSYVISSPISKENLHSSLIFVHSSWLDEILVTNILVSSLILS